MIYLKLSSIALPIFAVMDFLWLGLFMSRFYSRELGSLARRAGDSLSPHWPSVGAVYVLLALSVAVFILPRYAGRAINAQIFALGALLGVIVYGVYDLTNYATLAGWSAKLAAVDILWGGIIYGTTSLLTGLVGRALKIV